MTAAGQDVAGRDATVTLVTPIRPYKRWLNVIRFMLSEHIPGLTGLGELATVHFTRWSVVRTFPYNGEPQVRERLEHPYLFWESDYNGLLEPYIEAFVRIIWRQIDQTWDTSYGFPGSTSVTKLTTYIKAVQLPHVYYYTAYPGATVRMILSSLEVAKEHRFLLEAERTATAEEFAVIYRGFLRRRQGDL